MLPAEINVLHLRFKCLSCIALIAFSNLRGQNYEAKSIAYNTLLGGVTGALGALINKNHTDKPLKALKRGFMVGCGGGALMYSGKKANMLIARKKNISYA